MLGSPDAVGEKEEDEDEESCGGGGNARSAATVREAAVPLWAERRFIVRRELRSPLTVRLGRATLGMVVAECRVQCQRRVTNTLNQIGIRAKCSHQYMNKKQPSNCMVGARALES